MPIRSSDLRRQLLRVSPETLVGAALQDIRGRPRPTEWLLLVDLGSAYAVLGVEDIAGRAGAIADPLNRPLSAFATSACPTADVEEDLEDARARLPEGGYLLVLRANQPYGVLTDQPARAASSAARLLLNQAPGWKPRIAGSAVLGVEDETPKAPVVVPPPAQIEPIQQRSDRYVNTDFAAEGQPDKAIDRRQPLQPGQPYFFRLNVGELEAATTIEAAPAQLPDFITKQDVELVIVLFSERFAIEQPTGVLSVPAIGLATVKTPASLPSGMSPAAELAQERLLFRVAAPADAGRADLRVNMYCQGLLVQSRLVTAVVGAGEPLNAAGAMRSSVLDFDLSPALAPSHLGDIAPHKLSLMLNSGSDGTHAFRVFGQDGGEVFQNSATLSPNQLTNLLNQSRNVLQQVAWGFMGAWDQKAPYRYEQPSAAQSNWRADVVALAVQGYRIYDSRIRNLAGTAADEDKLRDLLRTPGMVQLASIDTASDVLPIALIYDYDLDTQNPQALTICPQFEESLKSGRDLLGEPCFLGNCPCRTEQYTVVCPSGFWGFRHDIGMPWSASGGPEMAKTIAYSGDPQVDIAYYQFPSLGDHLEKLAALGFQAQRQDGRDPTIQMFKSTEPQVVYFYCHGVTIKQDAQTSIPALMIGSQSTPGFFDTSNFRARRIRWPQARPLVIINGCHTTDISPDQALSFVQTFIEYVEAAGVIGTQITIFEPLAQRFAETFLQAFRAGEPLGRAVRRARLDLLAQYNPLGLVYQPFGYAGLKLVAG
jgi:hypothetical protein